MADKLDLLLKGGHVIDPANDVDGVCDVGIRNGKIACVAADIPAATALHSIPAEGLLVTPGLIDMHVHCYHTIRIETGGLSGCVRADAHLLKEGVTTCVDAGTAGADDFEHFRKTVIERSVCRILAFVNICGPGMGRAANGVDPEQDTANMDPERCAAAVRAHRDVVVGVKTAHYWTAAPFDGAHPPWASVDRALEAAAMADTRVMADFWPRPPERPYPDLLLRHLRPGDIHTHVFARQFPVVDAEGRVLEHMRQARERGILFDLGHGSASFWFRNAAQAVRDRFPPDTISTDLHMGNVCGPVNGLLDVMSKHLAMGMSVQEVVARVTVAPARALGHPELGTLAVGAPADVALLGVLEGDFFYPDCGWACIDGQYRLECALTLRAGNVVFDRHALSLPHWQEVAASSGYFDVPATPVPVPRLWVGTD